jgi:preprotein translocase subunit SecB
MAKKTTKKVSATKATTPQQLISKLALRHVRLITINSDLHIANNELPTETKIQFTSSLSHVAEDSTLRVDIEFSLHAEPKDSVVENPSFVKIEMHHQMLFSVNEDLNLKQIEQESEAIGATGALVVWPYIRELVHSISMRMGIPAFILPLYSIGPGFQKRLDGVAGTVSKPRTTRKKKKAK